MNYSREALIAACLFALDERFAPGRRLLPWAGSAALTPGSPPLEIPLP